MTKRLKRVSPLQLGKVLGIFYALFSLIFIPFLLLACLLSAFGPNNQSVIQAGIGLSVGLIFAVLAPIFYGIMGFIFGVVGAWLYNLVASWTGGIEVEIE